MSNKKRLEQLERFAGIRKPLPALPQSILDKFKDVEPIDHAGKIRAILNDPLASEADKERARRGIPPLDISILDKIVRN